MKLKPGEFKVHIFCPACGISAATICETVKNKKGEERIKANVSADIRIMAEHRKVVHGETGKGGRLLSAKLILESHRKDA